MGNEVNPDIQRVWTRIDRFALPVIPLALVGYTLLFRGVKLATPFMNIRGDPHGLTLLGEGLLTLLVGAAIFVVRRRPYIATLVVSPGVITGFLVSGFPEAGYGWIGFALLVPVSAIAAVAGCIRRPPDVIGRPMLTCGNPSDLKP